MFKARILGGSDKLARRIRHIRNAIPVIVSRERMGSFLVRRIKERFLKQVDPSLVKWKELSPNTKKGKQILFKRGYLYHSIQVLDGSGQQLGSSTGAGFRIGIKSRKVTEYFKYSSRQKDIITYARVHQFGNAHVDRRKFLGISRLDVKAVGAMMYRDFRKALRGENV